MANLPLCYLCRKRLADKMNSHIIPKFLGKDLFEDIGGRHVSYISIDGLIEKRQDIIKVDNLLCSKCESRLSIIERYFANYWFKLLDYKKYPKIFELNHSRGQGYLVCNDLHPTIYKLFFYSIIWRVSVCSHFAFEKYKLPLKDEEELRLFLDNGLRERQKLLLNEIESIQNVPKFDNCLLIPVQKSEESRGAMAAYQAGPNTFLILSVYFILFFYTDKISIGEVLGNFNNDNDERVLIPLIDEVRFKDFNLEVAKMVVEKK